MQLTRTRWDKSPIARLKSSDSVVKFQESRKDSEHYVLAVDRRSRSGRALLQQRVYTAQLNGAEKLVTFSEGFSAGYSA